MTAAVFPEFTEAEVILQSDPLIELVPFVKASAVTPVSVVVTAGGTVDPEMVQFAIVIGVHAPPAGTVSTVKFALALVPVSAPLINKFPVALT